MKPLYVIKIWIKNKNDNENGKMGVKHGWIWVGKPRTLKKKLCLLPAPPPENERKHHHRKHVPINFFKELLESIIGNDINGEFGDLPKESWVIFGRSSASCNIYALWTNRKVISMPAVGSTDTSATPWVTAGSSLRTPLLLQASCQPAVFSGKLSQPLKLMQCHKTAAGMPSRLSLKI